MKNQTSIQLLFCTSLLLSACSSQKQLVNQSAPNNTPATVNTNASPEERNVLYIVDGKPVSKVDSDKIDPNDILSVEVFKSKDEVKKYTTENYDGVVVIRLKK
ncbi:MAG: hypothetical protein U0289_07055 [Cyclobacteriaceae bacterium]|jgi:hypothetical protein|nr:hypothetical protein [Cyclobacteriaceae bacterium]